MCYFLYIASPLTLSEVRSMLPRGLTADLSPFADQQTLKSIHPDAQTVARILAGRCSCDLVRPRHSDTREDERHLRERYRGLGVTRDVAVRAFERHRRSRSPRAPAEGWPGALAKFVAEHARNAGPTLYHLHFSANDEAPLSPLGHPHRVALSVVTAGPEGWLAEGTPTLISR
jgi:hypothetical protein